MLGSIAPRCMHCAHASCQGSRQPLPSNAVARHWWFGELTCAAILVYLQALCNSGVVYRELDRLEEAVAAYEDALAVCPRVPLHCGSIGCTIWSFGAKTWLLVAGKHGPGCRGVVTRLVLIVYSMSSCCSHSVVCVLQVAPNYPIVRNNLAVALTDLGTTLKVRGQLKAGRHIASWLVVGQKHQQHHP